MRVALRAGMIEASSHEAWPLTIQENISTPSNAALDSVAVSIDDAVSGETWERAQNVPKNKKEDR
ncbi:hypothetical protein EP30_04695 [Bifidobacterium sp. UTCIF-39]|nr:hypothetical protein EP30_04695 [Bifidobacterium sp. UTCIF-39]